jgi:hypothetical protein
MQLRDVSPGCRVYISMWNDGVLYEVQRMPHHSPLVDVVSEDDHQRHALLAQTQVVVCEEDEGGHEYRANCTCVDCTERRHGFVNKEEG